MLYRPNFCCQCGEKIVRARWTPLTSRRFCEFCEIEQKQHELLPKVAIAIAFLVGAAGLTAYIGGPADSRNPRNSAARIDEVRDKTQTIPQANAPRADRYNLAAANVQAQPSSVPASNSVQREVPQLSSTEAVYYCGAITKKGTPCTRRVKVKGRCWQHTGQSAIPEKRD